MRATEIIRGVLDLIDQVECAQVQQVAQPDPIGGAFAQIFAQLSAEQPEIAQEPETVMYNNSPNPHVQGIESVTTAVGLGTLGAAGASDIRSNTVSMYPNHQAKG